MVNLHLATTMKNVLHTFGNIISMELLSIHYEIIMACNFLRVIAIMLLSKR